MFGTFGKLSRPLLVVETGTHSPCVGRLLSLAGHDVIVANACCLPLVGSR
jgi:hypothetical protein